jgi:hypothetical protein
MVMKPMISYWGESMQMPLFRASVSRLNPFALMRRFTEDMDRTFGSRDMGVL